MLSALTRGKFKIESNLKEDSLTASVLEYLLLLPDTMVWDLIRKANPHNYDLKPYVGKLIRYQFWPKWDTTDIPNVENKKFIEPDVIIEFEYANVVIEAKRYDKNQQNQLQWKNQIIVYNKHYVDDSQSKKELIYIALGGVRDLETTQIEISTGITVKIQKLQWKQIMLTIYKYIEAIECSKHIIQESVSYLRILITIISALELHGYYLKNHLWLEDISATKKNISKSTQNILLWKPTKT